MTQEEIKIKLRQIFAKVFGDENIVITEDLTADKVARWDSLSHLTMISDVESGFGIKFKLKELVGMKNVGELISLIEAKTNPN